MDEAAWRRGSRSKSLVLFPGLENHRSPTALAELVMTEIAAHPVDDIVGRIERLPTSWWQIRTRIIVGVATFFDAFDALAIASILPVVAPLWKLAPAQIGWLISAGFVGQLLGALVFGFIAERRGRIAAMVWSIALFSAMSLVCALAWDYYSLLAFRTIQGIGLGGEVPVAAVFISELAKAQGRGRFVLLYELVFPIGLVAASLVGLWVVPHLGWQYMFVIGALPGFLALVLRRLLPESPRWLAVRGRFAEAEAAMALIERETQRGTGEALPAPKLVVSTLQKPASLADLFGPLYLRRTLVVWVIWFSAYFVNYGLSIWLPTVYRTVFKLPLDQSLRYGLITQAVGLIGTLICALAIDHVGRRPWFALSFVGATAALAVLASYPAPTAQQVLTCMTIAYFFVSSINIGVYLYTPELYPTRVRAVGVGTATAWLRLASIIGPTVVGMMIASGLPTVFMTFAAVAGIAAVITGLFAVETKGRILEEASP
jgi:MFS transporter, putative metabolite:H+ symporter